MAEATPRPTITRQLFEEDAPFSDETLTFTEDHRKKLNKIREKREVALGRNLDMREYAKRWEHVLEAHGLPKHTWSYVAYTNMRIMETERHGSALVRWLTQQLEDQRYDTNYLYQQLEWANDDFNFREDITPRNRPGFKQLLLLYNYTEPKEDEAFRLLQTDATHLRANQDPVGWIRDTLTLVSEAGMNDPNQILILVETKLSISDHPLAKEMAKALAEYITNTVREKSLTGFLAYVQRVLEPSITQWRNSNRKQHKSSASGLNVLNNRQPPRQQFNRDQRTDGNGGQRFRTGGRHFRRGAAGPCFVCGHTTHQARSCPNRHRGQQDGPAHANGRDADRGRRFNDNNNNDGALRNA